MGLLLNSDLAYPADRFRANTTLGSRMPCFASRASPTIPAPNLKEDGDGGCKSKDGADDVKLVRKSLMVDAAKLEQARKALGALSDSEVLRLALDHLLTHFAVVLTAKKKEERMAYFALGLLLARGVPAAGEDAGPCCH